MLHHIIDGYTQYTETCAELRKPHIQHMSSMIDAKHDINTAITVKLLKSKVTLLNTYENLKMTHETQCDLGIPCFFTMFLLHCIEKSLDTFSFLLKVIGVNPYF